ncbi:ethanolamine kinase-like [Toxorhynchites rutilus septentrionalis]|uniref:ethanolamine kinase-like n=1 Tax=Toxorhynchites rutilus septentrionalis TaxID=329112 RepID=UPI00247989E4|nr:ethanolamine kinase-like [Toxorhynchites rutilus septentrionalis]XP_055641411.1 ethanolamine kinase-like [Toxorhynchites rutilus septentrionalis]
MAEVFKLDLTIDENDVIGGAKEVLNVIRPHWMTDCVRFKLFTDGITNKLVGCFNQNNNVDEDADGTSDDVVLVRVYGNKTDLLIDRTKETENIRLLHRYGFAPTLYATFRNGLAYEYVPGVTLTPESCREERIARLVATRMAQMHKVKDGSIGNREPMLEAKIDQFLKLIPPTFSDPSKHSRISKIFPSAAQLRRDFDDLYGKLRRLDSPVVFCHNDLLLGNVIFSSDTNRVTFIDYEYAAYNHQAFDIGNHFTEFAGIDEIDYDRYPSKEFQLQWLRVYLEEFNGESCTESDLEKLYVHVNQFALASHFLWAVWALIQAEHSNIDFDFIRFGEIRYNEYLRRRDEFLSLAYQN